MKTFTDSQLIGNYLEILESVTTVICAKCTNNTGCATTQKIKRHTLKSSLYHMTTM